MSDNPFADHLQDEAAAGNPGGLDTPFGTLPAGIACFLPAIKHWGPILARRGFMSAMYRNKIRSSFLWKRFLQNEPLQKQIAFVLRETLGAEQADELISTMMKD